MIPGAKPALSWTIPAFNPVLTPHAAHVWQADLDAAAAQLSRWKRHLSPEEKARAAGFRFARDRERFVAARGLLRELLAVYTQAPPSQFRFGCGAQGKPLLRGPRTVFFNVSHSGGKALFGFARSEIGVDIERIRPFEARVVERALSPPERRALSDCTDDTRHAAFFRFWTRKEAFLKAEGHGLTRALHDLDVSGCEGGAPWGRISIWHPETQRWREDGRWNLWTLEVGLDYAAALAARSPLQQPVCWRWNG